MKPKRNEQIRAQADKFPSDVHQQIVVSEYENEHREHEQVEIRKESTVTFVVFHVADGINVDEKADARDDEEHQCGKRIEQKRDIHLEYADGNPRIERQVDDAVVFRQRLHGEECHERNDERQPNRTARDCADKPAWHFATKNCVDCCACKW